MSLRTLLLQHISVALYTTSTMELIKLPVNNSGFSVFHYQLVWIVQSENLTPRQVVWIYLSFLKRSSGMSLFIWIELNWVPEFQTDLWQVWKLIKMSRSWSAIEFKIFSRTSVGKLFPDLKWSLQDFSTFGRFLQGRLGGVVWRAPITSQQPLQISIL